MTLQSIIDLAPSEHDYRSLNRRAWAEKPSASFRRPYGVDWDGSDLLITDPDSARIVRVSPSGVMIRSAEGLFLQPADVAACSVGILVTDPASGRIAILDEALRFSRWFAQDLARPTGIACDGERTFVVETSRHRVLSFVSGSPGPVLGTRGTGPGQFNFPTSITAHDGNLLVGDALNFRIQRIDPDSGQVLSVFGQLGDSPGEMARLKGIAVDGQGNVWAADAHLDRVSIYGLDGELLLSIGGTGQRPEEFSFPAGIAVHEDGRVAVIDSLNKRIKVFRVAKAALSDGA